MTTNVAAMGTIVLHVFGDDLVTCFHGDWLA